MPSLLSWFNCHTSLLYGFFFFFFRVSARCPLCSQPSMRLTSSGTHFKSIKETSKPHTSHIVINSIFQLKSLQNECFFRSARAVSWSPTGFRMIFKNKGQRWAHRLIQPVWTPSTHSVAQSGVWPHMHTPDETADALLACEARPRHAPVVLTQGPLHQRVWSGWK